MSSFYNKKEGIVKFGEFSEAFSEGLSERGVGGRGLR